MQINVSSGSKQVEVVPSVKVQESATIELLDFRGFDVITRIHLNAKGKLVANSVEVRQREGGEAVTSEAIRKIPVQQIIKRFVRHEISQDAWGELADGTQVVAFGLLETAEAQQLRASGPVAETLRWVAIVYKLAEFLDDPPTKAVETSFSVSRSTAGAWIGRARAAGLIAPHGNDEV